MQNKQLAPPQGVVILTLCACVINIPYLDTPYLHLRLVHALDYYSCVVTITYND